MYKLMRLLRTIRHLHARQLWYRLYYPFKKCWYRPVAAPPAALQAAALLPTANLQPLYYAPCLQPDGKTLTFLNRSVTFGAAIDWNYKEEGKLWTYHLNYFQWLEDENLDVSLRLQTLMDYNRQARSLKDGLEPYPISLRLMHGIRFMWRHNSQNQHIQGLLYAHAHRLSAFVEYHLMGNHLLENACGLLAAALYFNDPDLYRQAKSLMQQQLNEQILPDGGHFERSPMYHAILLERLLLCLDLQRASGRFMDEGLSTLLQQVCGRMLGWLQAFCYSDGSYEPVQDADPAMSLSLSQLQQIAHALDVSAAPTELKESGYRMIRCGSWELLWDCGSVGPGLQPGHAHAHTLSIWLRYRGMPVLCDTGTSTYEPGPRRLEEKGTAAHNTLYIKDENSTELWSSFRAGRRARVLALEEGPGWIAASQDGYRHLGLMHRRRISWDEKKIVVEDWLKGFRGQNALLLLHLGSGLKPAPQGPNQFMAGPLRFRFYNCGPVDCIPYHCASGFNRLHTAVALQAVFTGSSRIEIDCTHVD